MTLKRFCKSWIIFTAFCLLLSCQKEIDGLANGVIPPTNNQKPKVGTTWVYRYNTYYSFGGLLTSKIIMHKALNEEDLGGEKWLNIIDVDANTTVYYLNTKIDGLYQYTNNNPYLFCKNPAAVNDTYTSFNDGSAENFTVRGVNDTLATGIGDVPANYYEGVKNGDIIDYIWYNDNAWIVQRIVWRRSNPPSANYYRYSTMFLNSIVY